MDKDPPVDVLRDGQLKANLWRNEGEKGPFYSTTFARTYTDEQGQPRDTYSFAGNELLRLSELARKAYDRTRELHREDRKKPERDKAQDRSESREIFNESRTKQSRSERSPEQSR